VKELLKSVSICHSYAQMKKGPVILTQQCSGCSVWLAHLSKHT